MTDDLQPAQDEVLAAIKKFQKTSTNMIATALLRRLIQAILMTTPLDKELPNKKQLLTAMRNTENTWKVITEFSKVIDADELMEIVSKALNSEIEANETWRAAQ